MKAGSRQLGGQQQANKRSGSCLIQGLSHADGVEGGDTLFQQGPFDAGLTQANMRENLGMVDAGETPEEASGSAATAGILPAKEPVDAAAARATTGRAGVQRGVQH